MTLDPAMSNLLRELIERVAKEKDPGKLRELILAINRVLDAIEAQLATLEGQGDPSRN